MFQSHNTLKISDALMTGEFIQYENSLGQTETVRISQQKLSGKIRFQIETKEGDTVSLISGLGEEIAILSIDRTLEFFTTMLPEFRWAVRSIELRRQAIVETPVEFRGNEGRVVVFGGLASLEGFVTDYHLN